MITPVARPKVLMVEDHADIRRLLTLTLELEDYEIHEAVNGAQGWERACAVRPDAMLLDVMMPGELDGLALCRRLRQTPELAGCKVVMLTARGQASDIRAGLEAGADAYLIKPFSPQSLIVTLAELLGRTPPARLTRPAV